MRFICKAWWSNVHSRRGRGRLWNPTHVTWWTMRDHGGNEQLSESDCLGVNRQCPKRQNKFICNPSNSQQGVRWQLIGNGVRVLRINAVECHYSENLPPDFQHSAIMTGQSRHSFLRQKIKKHRFLALPSRET